MGVTDTNGHRQSEIRIWMDSIKWCKYKDVVHRQK